MTLLYLGLVIALALLLATLYKKYRWWVFCIGLVLLYYSLTTIGLILVSGALLSFTDKWIKNTYAVKSINVQYSDKRKTVDDLLKMVDEMEFSDSEEILNIIQRLSKIDKDYLLPEQINSIRKTTANLWKQYYDLSKENSFDQDMITPYDILGVSIDATQEEIRRAYIKLCKQYHPDINHSENAENIFKEIQDAYDILCASQHGDI